MYIVSIDNEQGNFKGFHQTLTPEETWSFLDQFPQRQMIHEVPGVMIVYAIKGNGSAIKTLTVERKKEEG